MEEEEEEEVVLLLLLLFERDLKVFDEDIDAERRRKSGKLLCLSLKGRV